MTMKRVFRCMMVALLALGASACNTVAGLGKDIQKGGQILQDAAKK
jgi:predicted small secreted protein